MRRAALLELALPLLSAACGRAWAQTPPPAPSDAGAASAQAPATQRRSAWRAVLLSGGGAPQDNALAHSRNIVFASGALQRLGVAREAQRLLVADGDDPAPDENVNVVDPQERSRRMTAALWLTETDRADGLLSLLRDHLLLGAAPATLASVQTALTEEASQRAPLLLYSTDHGAPGPRNTADTQLVLWRTGNLGVRQLTGLLERFPPARRVVLVMSQCYSGGFARVVRSGARARGPLAEHDRCGFFAAPEDRESAGCTSFPDESEYDDYTTRFFAALGGQTRVGQPVPLADADADGDGVVQYDEAHLYALARDGSTDVPVCTSEQLLRDALGRPAAPRVQSSVLSELTSARPALLRLARLLLSALALPESTTREELDRAARQLRAQCPPGLCETEDAIAATRRGGHRALRLAFGPPPNEDAEPEALFRSLDAARLARMEALARPWVEALRAQLQAHESLDREYSRQEALRERLRRVAEWALLEARAQAQGGALWAEYQRLRACEHSSPTR